MIVAVVDIGTNSTRLLIAEVSPDGAVQELDRRSEVTRLGQGVYARGALSEEAIERVMDVLEGYHAAIDAAGCERTTAVLTSAVRDADNGSAFSDRVRERFGFDARVIPGEEEAQLTFAGAMSDRAPDPQREPAVVIDIGGGSTEFVVGGRREVIFHASTQAGVVRLGERHVHHDPPHPGELEALARDARRIFADGVPAEHRREVRLAIAVAGTPTALAAIAQELDPYDPHRTHGYVLELGECEGLLARLAGMDNATRRELPGLHPDRAPTIVPGAAMLIEAMRLFDLKAVEVSEHDILRGAALRAAA
ncbi:MAG TPA: Ppx/GppA phosphatase family protein [Solirubrobacteraceae bacterium]|nr:Ppx/GppA phosphatase family protein [Solirubrobacteraceae bacterium]